MAAFENSGSPETLETAHEREELSLQARHLAAIAHELRNPIQCLSNALHLLQELDLNLEARRFLEISQRELSRLKHITTQVLKASHSDTKVDEVSLARLLQRSLQSHAEPIERRNIRIHCRFECDGLVAAAPVEVRQVLDNLLANAIDAVLDGGKIVIHLYESRDWQCPHRKGCRVVIADNGPGIPHADRRKIFQPFFTTKTETGTGLGLWVAQRLVNEHHGSIRIRSSVLRNASGTAFSIFFPQKSGMQHEQ